MLLLLFHLDYDLPSAGVTPRMISRQVVSTKSRQAAEIEICHGQDGPLIGRRSPASLAARAEPSVPGWHEIIADIVFI